MAALLKSQKFFKKWTCDKVSKYILFVVTLSCAYSSSADGSEISDPYLHKEVLDSGGKYHLTWVVDWEKSRVIFNVTVQTNGYIGFGLSRKGQMHGADIVIGGVYPNGDAYFTDRHGTGNYLPEVDDHQDWTLHSAWERGAFTFLSFSRQFDTCDGENDLPIHDDVIGLIFAFGEKDELEFHHQNRGVFYAYLLDPEIIPDVVRLPPSSRNLKDLENMRVWTISGTYQIPPKDTTYICTMHRAPRHGTKQHIIGFNSILETDLDRKHIHHFLLHRCHPPVGVDPYSIFHRHVGIRGQECYLLGSSNYRIPTQFCTEVVHVWAVGQKANFFPSHVGIPFSENENEYFMLQMHYDNPEMIQGIQVRYALEVFYTENVREHDAGVITLGGLTPASPSLLIPPNSPSHLIYGHCGSGCTQKIFPDEGIHVFGSNLHTHLAGRGVRLMHFRNNEELPWVSYDDNYNFNFQQIRLLRQERTILPGDSLINRCVFSNTDRNGSVTVGGFSTRNEMCTGFIWYYNKIPNVAVCRSDIRSDFYRSFLDIWNTKWSDERIEMMVTSPTQHRGLSVSEVATNLTVWTIEKSNLLQKFHRGLPQITQCPPLVKIEAVTRPPPFLQGYLPQKRIPTVYEDLASQLVQHEVLDPEYEFISIYPEEIVPYERSSKCWKRR